MYICHSTNSLTVMKKKQHKMEQTFHAEFISQEKDVEQQQSRFKVFNFFTSFRQKNDLHQDIQRIIIN